MAIHPPHRVFYELSIQFCLGSAARSIEAVSSLVEHIEKSSSRKPLKEVDPQAVLDELQNIIVQGAAVSRYFWPVRKQYEQRGTELRRMYDVSDASPLRSRDLRNAIEHFDERLDDYLAQGIVGNIYPHYLGAEPPPSQVKRHFFRAYFLNTGVFQLLDHRFQVEPLAKELWRLAGGTAGEA